MVTGAGSETVAIEAMKLGAKDYLIKDINAQYLELFPSIVEQIMRQQHLAQEKQQAIDALAERNQDLAMLNRVGQELTMILDVDQAIQHFLSRVVQNINAEAGSVWLLSKEKANVLVCQGVYREDQQTILKGWRIDVGQGIVGWVAQTGKAALVANVRDDPRFYVQVDESLGYYTNSLLAVPLRIRGYVIGVVELTNKYDGSFNQHDKTLLETLAASAAIAIENARLIDKLHQRTIELEVQNQELDAFAYTVAHDLKTPLSGMVTTGNLLIEYTDQISEDEKQELLRRIVRNGMRMDNIIRELLLLASVRKEEIELRPVNMATVVDGVLERLDYMVKQYNAEVSLPDSWPVGIGYPPWVEEVWANYLSNALKYGGRPPHVLFGADRPNTEWVRFWIQDNGNGISPADQETLFVPFARLNQVSVQGQGLGLSIVQRIAEKLDGQVGVESKLGIGSRFWFTLRVNDRRGVIRV